jgi:hypothetical protein
MEMVGVTMTQTAILEDGSELHLIHFAVRRTRLKKLAAANDEWEPCCNPSVSQVPSAVRIVLAKTDDARCVTCPLCQETKEWKDALAVAPAIAGRAFPRRIFG